jgi:hypothetical protein
MNYVTVRTVMMLERCKTQSAQQNVREILKVAAVSTSGADSAE